MEDFNNEKVTHGCIIQDENGTIFFDLSLDSIPTKEEKSKIYKDYKAYSKKLIQQLNENKRLDKEIKTD